MEVEDLGQHISRRFNEDLEQVRNSVLNMGGLVEEQLDLPADAKVAINGYTCFAVYDAVVRAGHEPVYVDVKKGTLNFP